MDQGRIGGDSVVSTVLYVEGGGESKALRTECRKGFRKFLERAGLGGRMPRISACGSRQQAYKDYRGAVGHAKSDEFMVLLVDSEGPVAVDSDAWSHLNQRDNWERPPKAQDDCAHLMVQCMEAWFLADRDALAEYFGSGFKLNALPRRAEVEQVPKADLERGLRRATRDCRPKGAYDKGSHSFDILGRIDPNKVTQSSPYANQFVEALHTRASSQSPSAID